MVKSTSALPWYCFSLIVAIKKHLIINNFKIHFVLCKQLHCNYDKVSYELLIDFVPFSKFG